MRKQDWIIGLAASILLWCWSVVPTLIYGHVWFRAPYTIETLHGCILTGYTPVTLLLEILIPALFFATTYLAGRWIITWFNKNWMPTPKA